MEGPSWEVSLDIGYEQAVERVMERLLSLGIPTVRAFDLPSACSPHPDGPCPHSGLAPCACRLVVLVVYGISASRVALVAHGCAERTSLSLISLSGPPPDPLLGEILSQMGEEPSPERPSQEEMDP